MPRNTHFEEFKDHTLLKHFLLVAYLKRWATILLKSGKSRVWFVDAFAGPGCDALGNPGSPVLAAEVAEKVNREIHSTGLSPEVGMRVIAIENNRSRYTSLRAKLNPWLRLRPQYVYVREGTLEERIDAFLKIAGDEPVLFFLDPFGIDGLSANLLTKALTGSHNEILALFSDEGAVRLHGKATADEPKVSQALEEVYLNPSIFGEDFDNERIEAARIAGELTTAGHKSNARAGEILDRAFGRKEWRKIIRNSPVEQRQQCFLRLYRDLLLEAGATRTLAFGIDTKTGRHKYTLVHASKHRRAFAAMKQAIHRTRSERDATQHTTSQTFLPTFAENDISAVADRVAHHFAGQVVRWSPDSGQTVQAFAIEETTLWLHERESLKETLANRGWSTKLGKSQAFRFPPA